MSESHETFEELQTKILSLKRDKKLILQAGDIGYATAPSNIALIKYWGKQEGYFQMCDNSNLSYTLGSFRSFTYLTVKGRFLSPLEQEAPEAQYSTHLTHTLYLNSQEVPLSDKMQRWLKHVVSPWAEGDVFFTIHSFNNFPTACGIASSASGFAALAGAVADLLNLPTHFTFEQTQRWIFEAARLGSGSARRSASLLKDPYITWERSSEGGSRSFSPNVHESLRHLGHFVLIYNDQEKSISSSKGHEEALSSPFYPLRRRMAEHKYQSLLNALKVGDYEALKDLTEDDAFMMHATMQTSQVPSFYLTSTLSKVLAYFMKYRDEHKIRAFWTLDAGPNPHILFLPSYKDEMMQFLKALENEQMAPKKIIFNKSITPLTLGKEAYLKELEKENNLQKENSLQKGKGHNEAKVC
jgi:diphosphomevalonate decarboxylase